MSGQESPGEAHRAGFFQQRGKTLHEKVPVFITLEDIPSLDTPNDHMLQEALHIQSGST